MAQTRPMDGANPVTERRQPRQPAEQGCSPRLHRASRRTASPRLRQTVDCKGDRVHAGRGLWSRLDRRSLGRRRSRQPRWDARSCVAARLGTAGCSRRPPARGDMDGFRASRSRSGGAGRPGARGTRCARPPLRRGSPPPSSPAALLDFLPAERPLPAGASRLGPKRRQHLAGTGTTWDGSRDDIGTSES